MTTATYIPPANPDLFKLGKKELQQLAAERSKRGRQAAAELDRRAQNRKLARS